MKYKCTAVSVMLMLLLLLFFYFIPNVCGQSEENRTMATFDAAIHPDTDSVVYRDSFMERLELAFSDQFPFRQAAVISYMKLFNCLENITYDISSFGSKKRDGQYSLHAVGNYELIADTGYITVCPKTEAIDHNIVNAHSGQLELFHNRFPQIKMYCYYVTQAYDTNWFDDYLGTSAADIYKQIVESVPNNITCSHLVYYDLEDYMHIHFKTDHHWNHRGARRGYEDIYRMLSKDFKLGDILMPIKEINVSDQYDFDYLGSYGRNLGNLYTGGFDSFSFWEYDFTSRKCSVIDTSNYQEIPVVEMGLYDEYRNGVINKAIGVDHYITMYGTAKDEKGNEYSDAEYPFVIRNNDGNGKNLLILGDSYGRGVRDELASHFDTTVYLDKRNVGKISIDYVVEQYDIDAFVIISNTELWDSVRYMMIMEGDE